MSLTDAPADPAARRAALERLVATSGAIRAEPPVLLPADPYFDLAGEEFGRRLLLTTGADGIEFCLRPDFTLPIATAYLSNGEAGSPRTYGYLGPVFRQRGGAPAEFEQGGLELLGQADPDDALDRVLGFAHAALSVYGVDAPAIRIGSPRLFEALLSACDLPAVWRPRIRDRFGHPEALSRLIARLADPHEGEEKPIPLTRDQMLEGVTGRMLEAGLSLSAGRTPQEIVDRYLEKRTLAAAEVPAATLDLLRRYLAIAGPVEAAAAEIAALAAGHGLDLLGPLEHLRRHAAALDRAGPVTFETGFSPRLDYYTGLVFEMTGPGGAVLASGGQYDRLLERLGASRRIAAAGCAVWTGRLEQEAGR